MNGLFFIANLGYSVGKSAGGSIIDRRASGDLLEVWVVMEPVKMQSCTTNGMVRNTHAKSRRPYVNINSRCRESPEQVSPENKPTLSTPPHDRVVRIPVSA